MKLLKSLKILMILIAISACSKEDNNDNNQAESIANRQSICENAQGYMGLYWDFANAQPTGLSQVPLLQNPGEQFIHSLQPLLGFTIPQGFSAFEITDPQSQTLGVDVLSNDNGVWFRWIPSSTAIGQEVSSQTVIAAQINALFDFYNFTGTPDVLCSEFKQEVFSTIPREFNARLLRFNDRIAQVWVITTYAASSTYFTISITTAPEADYNTQVIDTFLPINFQLYVNDNGNIVDQDGDGWTVLEDPDDTDPDIP